MRDWKDRLPGLAAALWWGSLTMLFVVVPLLFKNLPTPALAGHAAARLFTAQSWISVGCALLLLALSRGAHEDEAGAAGDGMGRRVREQLFFVLFGLLLALLVEYAVAPHIVARDNLRLWHPLGSGMLVVEWGCAAAVLWRLLAPRSVG